MKNLTAYTALIATTAQTFTLPQGLLEAQVIQESGGNPEAFRFEPRYFLRYIRGNEKAKALRYGPFAACSVGLMQLMVETAYEMGFTGRPEELFDAGTNLQLGAKKMRALWDWAGGTDNDYPRALAAYNEGPANAVAGPPFADQAYVNGIYRIAQP